jgi:hypothetical protein
MFSVRIRGRGGQGVVTVAELLSVAAALAAHDPVPRTRDERIASEVSHA